MTPPWSPPPPPPGVLLPPSPPSTLQACDATSVGVVLEPPPQVPPPPLLQVCDAMSVGVVLAPDGSIAEFEVASTRVSITQRLT